MTLDQRLIGEARTLLERPQAATAGLWPRAAAVLARQAIESAMRELWRLHAPSLESCSARAQLLCLGEYLRDEELAAAVSNAWGALSRACHHHPYEIDPTAEELRGWIKVADRLTEAIERRA